MSDTPSKMIPLGSIASNFTLTDTITGKHMSLSELKSDIATVVMFICNHCPFVKHIIREIVELANDYKDNKISFIAISSNDAMFYPEDSPERMKRIARDLRFPFPYLYDESQDVARAYNAACTPDFFVYDKDLKLVYRGQFDDSRPGNDLLVTGKDLRLALEHILGGNEMTFKQRPSVGCNIKWK